MWFKNKKGLELPITAIIVLIISITFLGLAVYFIKTMFGGGTEIIGGQLAKIKDELRKDMEQSGESFTFSSGSELEIKRGEPFQFYVGVKNTASEEKCYRILMSCLKPFTPDATCPAENVGGKTSDGTTVKDTVWFPKLLSEFTVPANDVSINPATLQISGAQPDTYQMEAKVYAGDKDCSNFAQEPVSTKRYHILLN